MAWNAKKQDKHNLLAAISHFNAQKHESSLAKHDPAGSYNFTVKS